MKMSLMRGRKRRNQMEPKGSFEIRKASHATYLQRLRRIRPLLRVHLKRLLQIVREHRREVFRVRNLRRAICGDEVERLQRVLVQVRRLALNHL